MIKKINLINLILFSLFALFITFNDATNQHWSAQWDLDFWYIYNSSLMASGIVQEWYYHPAVSFLAIFVIAYKVYSLLDNDFIFRINDIIISNDPDLILQNLFIFTRMVDAFNIIFMVLFFLKPLFSNLFFNGRV